MRAKIVKVVAGIFPHAHIVGTYEGFGVNISKRNQEPNIIATGKNMDEAWQNAYSYAQEHSQIWR